MAPCLLEVQCDDHSACGRDQLAHPLYGEQKKGNALLLRLTQCGVSSNGAPGLKQPAVHAEIVARVTSSYRWDMKAAI